MGYFLNAPINGLKTVYLRLQTVPFSLFNPFFPVLDRLNGSTVYKPD